MKAKYMKYKSDNRWFVFERLGKHFKITVYERPTGIRIKHIYHHSGVCFIAGATAFWSLLSFAHKLKRMGFTRIKS